MSTNNELLLLHLAQAEQSLERAKNNAYSDARLEDYHHKLVSLFHAVKKDIQQQTKSLSDSEIYDGPKKILDFIFKSLEFLDSSTLNQIPYEIVACLKEAMDKSIEVTDRYIIVTSLINNVLGFSYDSSIAFEHGLYTEIQTKYGIEFMDRLVQINLPRAFSRDYLSAVVLYHELGHFVDYRFSLINSLTKTVLDDLFHRRMKSTDENELVIYFPYLANYIANPTRTLITATTTSWYNVILSHFREYFCDLFAAQYIGEASSHYLKYVSQNSANWIPTHPSCINREKVVGAFLKGTPNVVVTLINQPLLSIKKTTLQKRYSDVAADDFLDLIPTEISSGEQLHGLFDMAWKLWLQQKKKMGDILNTSDTLKIYNVINNLVEKSIGNYITVNKWNQAYKTLHPQKPTPTT